MPIHALKALKVFEESGVPSVPSGRVVVNKPARAQTSVGKSDGTAAKLARVSPVTLAQPSEAVLDKQIEKKLKSDEPLLTRVKAIFTSYEDKKNFLDNLEAVKELYKQGNIEFHDIRDPSSILRRLAFQFAFIGFSPPFAPPFKLSCISMDKEEYPEVRITGMCEKIDHLDYQINILDNDKCESVVSDKELAYWRDLVEDAEPAHVVQHYLKDLLGIYDAESFYSKGMFMEIPEHLKILLYVFLGEYGSKLRKIPTLKMKDELDLEQGAHREAAPVSIKIIEKLNKWEARGLIKREDLPQCVRAYTIIFSLVNPREIFDEGNSQIYMLIDYCKALCFEESDKGKRSIAENIKNLLSKHSKALRKKGFKDSDFALIKQIIKIVVNNFTPTVSIAQRFVELTNPINRQQYEFTSRVVKSVLSIKDPKTLFEVAAKTIENGGFAPELVSESTK